MDVKYAVGLPTVGEFGDVAALLDVAVAAERHGWDGVHLWDHVLYHARAFGLAQVAVLRSTAELIRRHHAAGHSVEQALSQPDEWAYPPEALALAVSRGYAEDRSDPTA